MSIYNIHISRDCIYIYIYIQYKPDDLNSNDSKKRSLHYKTQFAVYYSRGDILRCMSRMVVTQCPQKWAFLSFVHWLVMPFPKAHWLGNRLASYRGYTRYLAKYMEKENLNPGIHNPHCYLRRTWIPFFASQLGVIHRLAGISWRMEVFQNWEDCNIHWTFPRRIPPIFAWIFWWSGFFSSTEMINSGDFWGVSQ